MGLRFRAKKPEQVFVVLKTARSVDVTPFDSYYSAEVAVLRYIRKNRSKHGFPENWSNIQVWIDWLNWTGESLVIFKSPIWGVEST